MHVHAIGYNVSILAILLCPGKPAVGSSVVLSSWYFHLQRLRAIVPCYFCTASYCLYDKGISKSSYNSSTVSTGYSAVVRLTTVRARNLNNTLWQ